MNRSADDELIDLVAAACQYEALFLGGDDAPRVQVQTARHLGKLQQLRIVQVLDDHELVLAGEHDDAGGERATVGVYCVEDAEVDYLDGCLDNAEEGLNGAVH